MTDAALAEGKTAFVDHSVNWNGTCNRQERVINALRKADLAYAKAMTFVRMDCDTIYNDEVAVFRGIPSGSTLVVLRGELE